MNHLWVLVLFFTFVCWLTYRLLRWLRKRVLQQDQPTHDSSDLLLNTLREQTLKERLARGLQAESEARLKQLALLHETILANLPLGLVVLDAEGRIDFVNEVAREWFEQPPEWGRSLRECSPQLADGMEELVVEHSEEGLKLTMDGPKGVRILQLGRALLPTGQRLLTLRDRTRLQALEEQVQLKRELAFMGEMASGIAHEVKNGLALIQGRVQLLAYGDIEENSQQIQGEIDRLLRCVLEFMKTSREETLVREPQQPGEWLAEQAQRWAHRPLGPYVRFHEPEACSNDLWVDPLMASIVLDNLIQNGLDACSLQTVRPSSIWVDVFLEPQKQGGWNLIVEDCGPGFTAEVTRKLFVPFVSTKTQGTGLGLFHCRKIAMAHGGRIEVLNRALEQAAQGEGYMTPKWVGARVSWMIPAGEARS